MIAKFKFPVCTIIFSAAIWMTAADALAASPILLPAPKELSLRGGELSLATLHEVHPEGEGAVQAASVLVEAAGAAGVTLKGKEGGTGSPAVIVRVDPSLALPKDEKIRDACAKEYYMLTVDKNGLTILARTDRGALYGARTASQLLSQAEGGKIPYLEISDWPALAFRAVLVDMAVLQQKDEYYRRLIRTLAAWKVNTVVLDLMGAWKVPGHESIAGPHAYDNEGLKSLVQYAEEEGIELIPIIQSFAHIEPFTLDKRYWKLLEPGSVVERAYFCPSEPEVLKVMDEFYAQTAEVFPSQWLHTGCDEISLGWCDRCRKRVESDGKDALVAQHITNLHRLVSAHNRRMVVYGDTLLAYREAADQIPKDIMIFDWHYGYKGGNEQKGEPPESCRFFKERGFPVVAVPALVCGTHLLTSSEAQLSNVEAFTKLAVEEGLEGVCTGVWVPLRYLSNSMWYGLAVTASSAWVGKDHTRQQAAQGFFLNFHGVKDNDNALYNAFQTVASFTPHANFPVPPLPGMGIRTNIEGFVWPDKVAVTLYVRRGEGDMKGIGTQAVQALDVLDAHRDRIKQNQSAYEAMILAARIEAHLGKRKEWVAKIFSFPPDPAALNECLAENRALVQAVEANWAEDCFPGEGDRVAQSNAHHSWCYLLRYLRRGQKFLEALASGEETIP